MKTKAARSFRSRMIAEQQIDFLLLQHRGRLVEQDGDMALDAAVERQRLGDLHHLAVGEGEVGAARAGIDVEMDLLQFLGRRRVHARLGDEAEAEELLLAAEEDVFGDGQASAGSIVPGTPWRCRNRRPGAARRCVTWLAVDEDAARIGLVDAVQHLEQRRFAGAVLADEADDLAAVDVRSSHRPAPSRPERIWRRRGFRGRARVISRHPAASGRGPAPRRR